MMPQFVSLRPTSRRGDPIGLVTLLNSAGAPPPVITHGLHGPSALAEASGVPMGVVSGVEYDLHEVQFAPRARVLLDGDGLPEFSDDYGDRIGEDGLLNAIKDCQPCMNPHEFIGRLCEAAVIDVTSALPDDCLHRSPLACDGKRMP